MTVAYDAKRVFQNFTGLGNYSRTLLKNLNTFFPQGNYQLFAPKRVLHPSTAYFLEQFSVHTPQGSLPSWWRTYGMTKDVVSAGAQIFHGLSHEIPIGIQYQKSLKTIVTMHDLVFKVYPEYTSFLQRQVYDLKFRYACNHADKIIAISQQTKQDIIKYYGISPERIAVIYQTCADAFQDWTLPTPALSLKNLPAEYMLYVGSVIERKNLLRIIEAISMLPKGTFPPLVVVGDGAAYAQKVRQLIVKKRLEKEVIWIDKMIYEELPRLYRDASVFIYPSEYEGFGIPIIEALFSRIPVITSSVSCLPEAAGSDSLLVNPTSSEEIAAAIHKAIYDSDLRQKMITKGWDFAQANFSAPKVTAEMWSLYEKIIQQ